MHPLRRLWLGTVGYRAAWDLQRSLARARRDGKIDDVLVLLEHPPVYTMGVAGDVAHLRLGVDHLRDMGADYVDVDRGGSVTFHGPGQLVAYPIVDLAQLFPLTGHSEQGDVIRYLRALESAVIATVANWGVTAVRRPSHTGVWLEPDTTISPGAARHAERQSHTGVWLEPDTTGRWRKLASIGVKLTDGITLHGVALNVSTELGWFDNIIPCGIEDAEACSLKSLTGVDSHVAEVVDVFAPHAGAALGAQIIDSDDNLLDIVVRLLGVAAKPG